MRPKPDAATTVGSHVAKPAEQAGPVLPAPRSTRNRRFMSSRLPEPRMRERGTIVPVLPFSLIRPCHVVTLPLKIAVTSPIVIWFIGLVELTAMTIPSPPVWKAMSQVVSIAGLKWAEELWLPLRGADDAARSTTCELFPWR